VSGGNFRKIALLDKSGYFYEYSRRGMFVAIGFTDIRAANAT